MKSVTYPLQWVILEVAWIVFKNDRFNVTWAGHSQRHSWSKKIQLSSLLMAARMSPKPQSQRASSTLEHYHVFLHLYQLHFHRFTLHSSLVWLWSDGHVSVSSVHVHLCSGPIWWCQIPKRKPEPTSRSIFGRSSSCLRGKNVNIFDNLLPGFHLIKPFQSWHVIKTNVINTATSWTDAWCLLYQSILMKSISFRQGLFFQERVVLSEVRIYY